MVAKEAVNSLFPHVGVTKALTLRGAVYGWVSECEDVPLLYTLNVNNHALLWTGK